MAPTNIKTYLATVFATASKNSRDVLSKEHNRVHAFRLLSALTKRSQSYIGEIKTYTSNFLDLTQVLVMIEKE